MMIRVIQQFLKDSYEISATKIEAVTNEMFRCIADDGVYFARVTNYKNEVEQMQEVAYTDYLSHHGLNVSRSIPSNQGRQIETIWIDGKEYLFVLYETAAGKHAEAEDWNAPIFYELGKQIGILHRLSKQFEDSNPTESIKDWYQNEEYQFLKYIPKQETTIRKKTEELLNDIQSIPTSRENYGLLHGDIWLENVLIDGNRITFVDFQDCEKNYYLFDLAVPIYSAVEYTFNGNGNIVDYQRSITKAILKGYQSEHELSEEMLDKLPTFLKLKEMFEYSLMHQYMDKDNLSEEQIRIMNHFRMRIERDD